MTQEQEEVLEQEQQETPVEETQSSYEVGQNEDGIKTISTKRSEAQAETEEEPENQEDSSEESNELENNQEQEQESSEEQDEEITNESEEEEEDDTEFYSSLSEEIGLDIDNEDKIVENLKFLAQINKDPEIKAIIDYKMAGGDMSQYYETKSLNVDSLQGKDLLERSYMLKNSDLAKDDKELAKMTFEKEFKSKFNLIEEKSRVDADDLDEWMEENGEELKYQEKLLEREQSLAKKDLTSWQQERTTPPADKTEQLSPEEIDRINQEYTEKVNNALESYEGMKIPISDDESYNVVLDEQTKKQAQEYLTNPSKFFEEHLGITTDEQGNGHIDPSVAIKAITKVLQADKIGKNLSEYALERHNNKTIEAKIENPPNPSDGLGVKSNVEKTKGQKIASQLKASRGF